MPDKQREPLSDPRCSCQYGGDEIRDCPVHGLKKAAVPAQPVPPRDQICLGSSVMANRQRIPCGELWNGEIRLCASCAAPSPIVTPSAGLMISGNSIKCACGALITVGDDGHWHCMMESFPVLSAAPSPALTLDQAEIKRLERTTQDVLAALETAKANELKHHQERKALLDRIRDLEQVAAPILTPSVQPTESDFEIPCDNCFHDPFRYQDAPLGFWEYLEKNKEVVAKWPGWLKGENRDQGNDAHGEHSSVLDGAGIEMAADQPGKITKDNHGYRHCSKCRSSWKADVEKCLICAEAERPVLPVPPDYLLDRIGRINEVVEMAYTFVQKSDEEEACDLYAFLEGALDNIYDLRQKFARASSPAVAATHKIPINGCPDCPRYRGLYFNCQACGLPFAEPLTKEK